MTPSGAGPHSGADRETVWRQRLRRPRPRAQLAPPRPRPDDTGAAQHEAATGVVPRQGTAQRAQHRRNHHRVRIPLILISHSGRSRSPLPVILITLFTLPEEGTVDGMTWCQVAATDG